MNQNNFISRKFKNEKSTNSISFDKVIDNSTISIVLGEPASGKTYQLENYSYSNRNTLFVELITIDDEDDIEENIEIVLLDSIDEALSKNDSDKILVRKLIKYIKKCKAINPNVKFVISCRYVEWKEIFESKLEEIDKEFQVYFIEELSQKDINLLLMNNGVDKDDFWNFIKSNYLEQLLKNILMTIHIIENFNNYKNKELKYIDIYKEITKEHLLAKTKNEREKRLKEISPNDMLKISSIIAIYMTLNRTRTITIEDINRLVDEFYQVDEVEITGKKLEIVFDTALFGGNRNNTRFFHKSIQEYLTAYFIDLKQLDMETIKKIFAHNMGFYEEFEEVIIYLTNIESRFFNDFVEFDPFIFRRHPYLTKDEQRSLFVSMLRLLDTDEQRGWNKEKYLKNSSLVLFPIIQEDLFKIINKSISKNDINYTLFDYLISLLKYNYTIELENYIFDILENTNNKKIYLDIIADQYINNFYFNNRLLNFIMKNNLLLHDSTLNRQLFLALYKKIEFIKIIPILIHNMETLASLYYPEMIQKLSPTDMITLFNYLSTSDKIELNQEQIVFLLLSLFNNYKYIANEISLETIDSFLLRVSRDGGFSFTYSQGTLQQYKNVNRKNLFINNKKRIFSSQSLKFVKSMEDFIKKDKEPFTESINNKLKEENLTVKDIELKFQQWIEHRELNFSDEFYIIIRDKIKNIGLKDLSNFIKRLKIIYNEKYQILEYDIKEVILYFIARDKDNYQYLKEFWIKNIEENHYYLRYMIQADTNEAINDFRKLIIQENRKIFVYEEDKEFDIFTIEFQHRNKIKYLLSSMGYMRIPKRQHNFVAKLDNIEEVNLKFLITSYYESFNEYQSPQKEYRLDEYAVMGYAISKIWGYMVNDIKYIMLLEELSLHEIKRLSIKSKYTLEKLYNLQLKNRDFNNDYYKQILDNYKNKKDRFFNYEKLRDDLIEISLIETENRKSICNESEDDTNRRFRVALLNRKYTTVNDQSQGGESQSSKGVGERDLIIRNKNSGIAECVIEAFQLDKSDDTTKIKTHYKKLFKKYDTLGNRENFILVYIKTKDFDTLWEKYKKKDFFSNFIELKSDKANLKIGYTEEKKMRIYHLFINFYSHDK